MEDQQVTTHSKGCSKAIITPISCAAVAAVMCVALAACSSAVSGSGKSADLAATEPSVSDHHPAAGAQFTLSVSVRNVGARDASATTLRYFLSEDATITTADAEVGTDTVAELGAAGSSSQSVELTAPHTEGTYHYGACVDAVQGESDKDQQLLAIGSRSRCRPPERRRRAIRT